MGLSSRFDEFFMVQLGHFFNAYQNKRKKPSKRNNKDGNRRKRKLDCLFILQLDQL